MGNYEGPWSIARASESRTSDLGVRAFGFSGFRGFGGFRLQGLGFRVIWALQDFSGLSGPYRVCFFWRDPGHLNPEPYL